MVPSPHLSVLEAGLARSLATCLPLASLGEVCRAPGLVTPLAGDGGPGGRKVPGITSAFDGSTGPLRLGRTQKLGHLCRKGVRQAAPSLSRVAAEVKFIKDF